MTSQDVNAQAVADRHERENESAFKRIAEIVVAARLWALTHEGEVRA